MRSISGAALANQLHSSTSGCPKCRTSITFIDGVQSARSAGIDANVVMCPGCHRVYTVDVSFSGYTIEKDITQQFGTICTSCEGSGWSQCLQCNGLKYLTVCHTCNGTKAVPCTCQAGRVTCSACKGSKKLAYVFGFFKLTCKQCSGRGTVSHNLCRGQGSVVCKICEGRGRLNGCPQCSATGRVACSDCSGRGFRPKEQSESNDSASSEKQANNKREEYSYQCSHCKSAVTVNPANITPLSGVEEALCAKHNMDFTQMTKVTCPSCNQSSLVNRNQRLQRVE